MSEKEKGRLLKVRADEPFRLSRKTPNYGKYSVKYVPFCHCEEL